MPDSILLYSGCLYLNFAPSHLYNLHVARSQTSIFPRLSDSFAARHALRMHQLELAKSLTDRLQAFKGNLSPAEAPVVPDCTEETDNTIEEGPILDTSELPKAVADFADFEVRV